MQIVSNGDNLHEMSKPVFWEKKEKVIYSSSAGLVQSVIKVKEYCQGLQRLPFSRTIFSNSPTNQITSLPSAGFFFLCVCFVMIDILVSCWIGLAM